MILNSIPNNVIRIGIISAAFLTVTLALVLLQPDGETTAEAPAQTDTDAVSRAQTGSILSLAPQTNTAQQGASDNLVLASLSTETGSAAVDQLTAGVLASLDATRPSPKAPTKVAAPKGDDALRSLTSNVLNGISGARAFTTHPSMEQLVTQALRQGHSDKYIEEMINAAANAGSIVVPVALRTNEGRVDTGTVLADLVRKSDPDAFVKPKVVSGEDGVEVRVVQRAGQTRQYNFYTVQPGDSLGAIAHRFYGDAALYTAIFDANRQFISRPDRIRVGQRLSIPSATSSG